MRANSWVLGVAACCGVASSALAHHSRAPYDMTTETVIEGTVAELNWKNPHISMTVEAEDSDGASYLQEIELFSIAEARVLGLRQDAITVGSHVTVSAHPGRSGPGARALGLLVTTSDGAVLPLNTDARFAVRPALAEEADGLAGRWAPPVEEFYAAAGAMFAWPHTEESQASLGEALSTPGALIGVCADFPPPMVAVFPDLREIEIDDAAVRMRYEAQGQNVMRVIHLDETQHPADVEPTLMGHSIGRWDGETLVIDTVAFAPHPQGLTFGVPSGPDKHMTERLALSEDRRQLRYDLTVEDPEHLTGPASFSMLWDYRPDLEPGGETCDLEVARRLLEPE